MKSTHKLSLFASASAALLIILTSFARYHRTEDHYDDNKLAPPKISHPRVDPYKPLHFRRLVVDKRTLPNERKPKVIFDPEQNGVGVIGALAGKQGFALYSKPNDEHPSIISPFHDGEDAQAADLTGNGAPDILIGGISGKTVYLRNPLHDGCSNIYRCIWQTIVIDDKRSSHDVVVGDINRAGVNDIATESGVYFHNIPQNKWTFVGSDLIHRDGVGTSLGDLQGDRILDIIAPRNNGTELARFINPLHHGGDPVKETWLPEAIDPHPLFHGNMTTAVADITGNGRNDVLLAPMYGGGGLVWYSPPRSPHDTWRRHLIDASINYVHQGSLQIADFNGDGKPDIAFAEQDQSLTRRVGVFYNQDGGRHWRLQVLSTEGGHNIKVGRLGHDRRPSILTARHGATGMPNPLLLWREIP